MEGQAEEPAKASTPPASMKDILGSIGGAVSVLSTAAFVLSVVYEWAYFSAIGPKFRGIASLTDYLTDALDWLPAVIAVVSAYWFAVVLLVMIAAIKPEEGKPTPRGGAATGAGETAAKRGPQPPPMWLYVFVISVLVGIGVAIYLTADPAENFWLGGVLFFLLWLSILSLAVSRNREPLWTSKYNLILFCLPPLFVGVFLLGLQHGYADLTAPGELYQLVRKEPRSKDAENVEVLRTFDRGVLVRVPEMQTNEFVRWDDIRSISLKREGRPEKSLSCQQFGFNC